MEEQGEIKPASGHKEVSDRTAYLKPISAMTEQELAQSIKKIREERPQLHKQMRETHSNRG